MITLYRSLDYFANFIEILIVIRIFSSILRLNMNNPIGSFIYQVTEPLLGLARNIIDKLGINTGMFDFSPLLGIFILRFILYIVRSIIF